MGARPQILSTAGHKVESPVKHVALEFWKLALMCFLEGAQVEGEGWEEFLLWFYLIANGGKADGGRVGRRKWRKLSAIFRPVPPA